MCFIEGEVNAIIDILVQILRIMIDGGRDDSFFECHNARKCFYGSCSTDQVTGHRLGGIQVHVVDMIAEHALDRLQFRHIAQRSGGTMCIDIIDVLRLQSGIFDGEPHDAFRSFPVGVGCRHMIRIGGHTFTYHLGVYLRAACFGMLVLLQDKTSSSFA